MNKLASFMSFVYSSNLEIICCTETWLTGDTFDNEILPSGYTIHRKDRSSRGGGVMIAVKDSITCAYLPSPSDLEVVSVQVGLPNPVTVCSVYAPPSASDLYHENLHSKNK